MSGERRSFNARPESTIAQNFADDLDAMFGLSPAVEELNKNVEQKKQHVTSHERELQELEERLRAAEQRLAQVSSSRNNSPSRPPPPPPKQAPPQPPQGLAPRHPFAQKPAYPDGRPPTAAHEQSSDAKAAASGMPGAMPGPHGGNDFVMVDRNAAQAQRGYG